MFICETRCLGRVSQGPCMTENDSDTLSHVIIIQKIQRGHRCRRLLSRCRTLPDDIWGVLLMFFKRRDPDSLRHDRIALILSLRVIRLKYMPHGRARSRSFAQLTRLVRKYRRILALRVLRDVFFLAHEVLRDASVSTHGAIVMANVLIEDFLATLPSTHTLETRASASTESETR